MTDEGSPPSSAPLEFQLLLDSAAPPRADAPVWAGPAVGLDWSGVLDRALEQGMVPLLRRHLAAGAWEGVPPAVRAWLEARHQENHRRNRLLTIELLALLDRLAAEGIEAIPFKGPIVAETCYGDLDARPFGDIDLLVEPRDVGPAMRIMAGAGYDPLIPLSETQRAAFLRHRTEYPLQRPSRGGIVDLHWELFHRQFCFGLIPDRARLREIRLADQPILTLGIEDQLLLLCAHATKHLWVRLEWIAALAWLVARTPEIDGGRARARARALGGERMLALGLALATHLLGAPAVPGFPREDAAVAALRDEVVDRLRAGSPPPEDWWRFYLRARERRRDRVEFLARTAVTPTIGDWRMVDLPPALAGLHYALRPFRLLGRGLRALGSEGGDA